VASSLLGGATISIVTAPLDPDANINHIIERDYASGFDSADTVRVGMRMVRSIRSSIPIPGGSPMVCSTAYATSPPRLFKLSLCRNGGDSIEQAALAEYHALLASVRFQP
jgi:hypothetical protein